MNPASELDRYTPAQLDRLHIEARRQAELLRQQAIGDFWQGFADEWLVQQRRLTRSATRLASSLARHARLRSNANSSGCY